MFLFCVAAHKSGLLRQWSLAPPPTKPEIVKTFRSIHVGPIACMKVGTMSTPQLSGGI
jgi:hypothetical protein